VVEHEVALWAVVGSFRALPNWQEGHIRIFVTLLACCSSGAAPKTPDFNAIFTLLKPTWLRWKCYFYITAPSGMLLSLYFGSPLDRLYQFWSP
jgi:hypothetical protein